LWETGNADARLLACMVADAARMSEAELDAWLAGIETYFLVDVFVAEVASQAPGRRERAERWIASRRDRSAQAGWDLMNHVAMSEAQVPDEYFEHQLDLIAERITSYGNWTRRSASNTITASACATMPSAVAGAPDRCAHGSRRVRSRQTSRCRSDRSNLANPPKAQAKQDADLSATDSGFGAPVRSAGHRPPQPGHPSGYRSAQPPSSALIFATRTL
jgi:hypothetical protein